MGSSQRLAAVAAVSHSRHYYNHTQSGVAQTEAPHYTVNIFFVSATLCGVLVAVCAACWRRSPATDKPEEAPDCRGVYTVSADATLVQMQPDIPGPPPAYETVVDLDVPLHHKPSCHGSKMQPDIPGPPPAYETVVDLDVPLHHKPSCHGSKDAPLESYVPCGSEAERSDNGLPSYEAAVLLKDTKL